MTLKKPVQLPDFNDPTVYQMVIIRKLERGREPAYYQRHKRPKWRVTPAIVEEYRHTKQEIMEYDYNVTFFNVMNEAISITLFFSTWSSGYMAVYKYFGISIITMTIPVENFNKNVLRDLLCFSPQIQKIPTT